jgi:hypothetical protein
MTTSAHPYTRITVSSGASPRWSNIPVPFWINENGYPPITNGSDFEAVLASFRTWQAVASANVQVDYRGTTSAHNAAYDGINMISFTDTSTPLGSSVIAMTLSYFKTQPNGQVSFDESDIIFSPAFSFSTSGDADKFDIQSVLTHEIGHFLGLDHAAMVSSVMVPYGRPGQFDQRTLQYDDIAAISEVYPKASAAAAAGEIQGTILSGALPVFGANVVAVDGNGVAWVSTLSQPSGSFDLKFLPPGGYKIYAEPLNQAVSEQNLSASWYHNLNTSFGATYYGSVSTFAQATTVTVEAGQATTGVDIQVQPQSVTGLNLTRPAFALRIPRNSFGTMTVGGQDIAPGTQFSMSAGDTVLGSPTYGGSISSAAPSSASMNISVSPGAVLGPRIITVMRGTDASIGSGAVVIVDLQPTLFSVLPASGPSGGGTEVTISGSNFRPGAQIFFGGLPASDVNVVSTQTISATAPANVPGTTNVVVMNSDGTSGMIATGFTYVASTPTISGISPTGGAPTTVVTISGSGFDTHPQNVQVQFNGTPANIVSTTTSTITVVVPFGATTGQVAVNVFGVAASGTVNFKVGANAPSANFAETGYNFIDASAAGGGSALSFSGPNPLDDGLASVQLPFTFSLFNDTYLAGSPVTISTNGWLSLEKFDDPYTYQNGPLPGNSAVDASGVARTIPPALIAPFHDDLALLPYISSISTKLTGIAPNRQFIIQFTRLTALDDAGRDQSASLTFEAILYEGSNDIQFVYQNVSGSHSDGSSATIGLQNLARNTAILTSFNQPTVRSGLFVTYHFNNGSYVASNGTLMTSPVSVRVIPYAPQNASVFSGVALFAPSQTTAVLKAFDTSGRMISGSGIQNPVTIALAAGQQYQRLVQELFGIVTFDGWIQVEASTDSLGVYTTTGDWGQSEADGSNAQETATDFVLFHRGATAVLVNPGSTPASVTVTDLTTSVARSLNIAGGSSVSTSLGGVTRIQSSQPVAAIERFGSAPKFGIGMFAAVSAAQTSLVIPAAVTGGGYATTLYLANPTGNAADATISYAGRSLSVHPGPNSATVMSLGDLLQIPNTTLRNDAVRITSTQPLLASLDIEDANAVVSLSAPPAKTDVVFPTVTQGNGLFTGLAVATGGADTSVTVEAYPPTGGSPVSTTIILKANQQMSQTLNELLPSLGDQTGGCVHIHSDQPIWTWEIFGSGSVLASAPSFP